MVGIPGRSKGCNTCRRRKKGCDLQRPKCGQCLRLKLHCEGYKRDITWVNMSTDTRPLRQNMPHKNTITLPESFNRSACREKYLGLFWTSYLPNGRIFPPDSAKYSTGLWINELNRMFQIENQLALKRILLAIAVTGVGLHDNQRWLVEDGINLYGSGLALLAGQLKSQEASVIENSSATSTLLSLYEILYGHSQQDRLSQVKNWTLHLKGELGFLTSRGPESYTAGFAHRLFVDVRMTRISTSIECRTPTVLNLPEWKTIPWGTNPKTAKDLLGDIFAEIPGMLNEVDTIRATTDLQLKEKLRQKLARKCRRTECDWLRWGLESAPQTTPIASDTMQANRILDHLISAEIMASYYSIGVFLQSILRHTTDNPAVANGGSQFAPRILCQKIIDILPTFLGPFVGYYGVHGAIFPSIVVITYLTEVNNGAVPAERNSIYALFANNENGKIIQHFVDCTLERLRVRGIKVFF